MTRLVQTLLADDFVWQALTNVLPARKKGNNTGYSIDCPMCITRGESRPDKKKRCGITNGPHEMLIHCYNCGFATKWSPGQLISKNLKEFLITLGMPERDVKILNYKALQYRQILTSSPEALALLPQSFVPMFEAKSLPKGAKPIRDLAAQSCSDPDFLDTATYLFSRGDDLIDATKYYWTPNTHNGLNRRLIIPFFHNGVTVGFTARAIDKTNTQRYWMDSQPNFLFNAQALENPTRKYVILVEGVFDALAIDAVGMLGSHLNAQQIAWIKSYGKTVILLPDRDRRGDAMIDIALENNWMVSFPVLKNGKGKVRWWDFDVNDAADATKRYGRLWTLASVIESAKSHPSEINSLRQWYI